MKNERGTGFFDKAFQTGTPECAILCALFAMVLALLYLSLGFWKTVFVALLMVLGAFIGGVPHKKQWIKDLINRLFPARGAVPYREENPEIVRAVREAIRGNAGRTKEDSAENENE